MAAPLVHVWIETPSSKARYAVEQLLRVMLGWEIRYAGTKADLETMDGPRLIYGDAAVDGAYRIAPSGWLREVALEAMDPACSVIDRVPVLFPMNDGNHPFDVVSATFYLLARVEEYLPLPEDAHGRPHTDRLHAARFGYLHRPIVDEWALQLFDRWRAHDARVPAPKRAYRQVFTVDLDNGFKYLGRSWWRTLGSAARDVLHGRWKAVQERMAVLRGRLPDPFVLDEEVLGAVSSHADRALAFVLAGDRGEWDHAVSVEHPRYARVLRGLAERMEIGVHPSYDSSVVEGLTRRETERLRDVVGVEIRASRQHFLRCRIPGTFRTALMLGTREEHSMGCHDRLGFRAGTCTPYQWYDLQRDTSTDLIVHPFCVMDNTLREKLRLSPDEAIHEVRAMIAAVRGVQGTFTGLWHESFLARTGADHPWRAAILRIIAEAAP